MADLWQQFHGLPKAIRDGVATPTAIAAVDELEQQYPGVELASFVMRVVVHEFPFSELASKISTECVVDQETATKIVNRLRQSIFIGVVADYLGLKEQDPGSEASLRPQLPANPVPVPRPPANLPVMVPITTSAPQSPTPVNQKVVTSSQPPSPQPAVSAPVSVVRPTIIPPAPIISSIPPAAISVPVAINAMPQPQSPTGSSAPTTQYSDDDAVEIASQASKLRTLTSINPNQDLDSLARQILIEQNLASSDELLERRSISIIKSRLKNLRTTEETVEMLTRDPKVGGLGLDREIALAVATATEKYAKTLKDRGMVRMPDVIPPPPMPVVPSVIQQKPAPMPPLRREAQVMASVPVENFTEAPRASRPIVRPADMPVVAPLEQPALTQPPIPVKPNPVIQRPRGTDRPRLSDVARPQVALGPAEELRSMTLIEFRRLGQGAGDAARRLLEKFQHLQRESFAVWAEAVAGWRQSAVYQLYLTMGRESMEKGIPISKVIADRGANGQPYLSDHEFSVVSDLNRQLQL